MAYRLPAVYTPGGLDLSLPATMRNVLNAVDGLNFTFTPSNDLVKRRGFVRKAGNTANNSNGHGQVVYESREAIAISVPGFGTMEFGVDPFGSPTELGYGDVVPRLVSLGPIPYIWETTALDVTCTAGNEDLVTICTQSDGNCHFEILDAGDLTTQHLDVNLDNGLAGGSPTLASLQSTIDAEANYSAVLSNTGGANVRAAGLNRAYRSVLDETDTQSFVGGYWKSMNPVITTPWPNIDDHYTDPDYENATAVSMNGTLYMNNGWDPMLKYDGQRTYYAGLPLASTPSGASTATDAQTGFAGTYKYAFQYVQIDNLGNEVLGEISNFSADITNNDGPGNPKQIQLKIGNLDTTTGYNTVHALVDGNQTASDQGSGIFRIQVQNDPTLAVGDTIFFYNRSVNEYETREVIAITDQTTHWDLDVRSSSTITLNDDDILCNNLRLRLYRTVAGGTTLYFLDDLPNNPLQTLTTYTDDTPDLQLGALWTEPENTIGLPPKCKYCTIYQNDIVLSGNPLDPLAVYHSRSTGSSLVPENFPTVNRFEVAAAHVGGKITGIYTLEDTLLIFTEDSIHTMTGNLATNTYNVELLSDRTGCVANATIKSVDRVVLFLSKKGIYSITPGSQRSFELKLVSKQLDPIFRKGGLIDYELHEKQSIAEAWPNEQMYIIYLPVTALTGTENYATASSTCFAYHLASGAWAEWNNINASGGMNIFTETGYSNNAQDLVTKESLWFSSREYVSAGVIRHGLFRMSDTETEIDYTDHEQAISFEYMPQWEFSNKPSGLKIYTEIGIDAFRGTSNLPYTPSGIITAEIFRDFDKSTVESTLNIDYLDKDRRIIQSLPLSSRRAIGINFKNSEFNKQILISGWNWESVLHRPEIRR